LLIAKQVEGEAQGDEANMKEFLELIYKTKGHPYANVVKLDTEDRDVVEGEADFRIRSSTRPQ
jgi:acylphosphatase